MVGIKDVSAKMKVQITKNDNSNSIDDERLFALLNTERKHLNGEH